jgi:LacI family transcriptional regulator
MSSYERLSRVSRAHFPEDKAGNPAHRVEVVREDLIVEGDYSIGSGYASTGRLLSLEPKLDAILCASDPMAWGALRALSEAGLRPGVDIDLIGCDDLPQTRHLIPGLTVVRTPLYDLGYLAARMIIEGVERGADIPGRMLKGELVFRDSVRRPS